MERFKELWQSGLHARHIDELINDSFQDFAPYAGAEHQRMSFVRQRDTTISTAVTIEDSGDLAFQTQHMQVGSMLFGTTGNYQISGALRVPLPLSSSFPASTKEKREAPLLFNAPQPRPDSSRRFFSSSRGAQLMYGISQPHALFPPSALYGTTFGQVEWDLDVAAPWSGRHMYGARCGPLSARFTSAPNPSRGSASNENSSDNLSGGNPTDRTGSFWRRSTYTFDLSCCFPINLFGKEQPAQNPGTPANNNAVNSISRQGRAETQHDNHPEGPVALTVGFRQHFTVGDTLLAVAFQTDRAIMNTIRHYGCPHGLDAVPVPLRVSSTKIIESDRKVTRDLVDDESNGGNREAGVWNFFRIPETAVQLLILQTLATSTNQALDTSGNPTNATLLGTSGFSSRWSSLRGANQSKSSSKPWYSLPTLVSCNISFMKQLVRLSVASIFHDEKVDFEAAVVMDTTPLMPSTPTLLKLGFNNAGRLALGITSLFNDALSVTLGVNAMRGKDMRFGIEVKV
ncbi:unnamed protein product [Phytomonas sp. EM1]|nr:unnamed protein product [Phytomonas sp. EM1]|eukprot:CCW61954.1 unnamed protein product [Phytomonas sp. isolate EM1]